MGNVAIILSGGVGSRFGGSLPKQFTKLAGRAVIEYTIDAFDNAKEVDEIIIVSQPAHINLTWDIIKNNKWNKVTKVFSGGKERFDSTYSALQGLEGYDDDTNVLFHDAVRPLVTEKIIHDCVNSLRHYDAVDVVIPSADTLVEVYDDGCIANIPNRSTMRRGQTPQAFKLGVIRLAYQRAFSAKKFTFTCDCGVVRSMIPGVRVATVKGSEANLKITQPIDLFIAEKMLQESNRALLSPDDDLSFLKNKKIIIFGGNSGIGLEIKNCAILSGAKVEIASRTFNGVDITNIDSVKSYLLHMEEKMGEIDYIVNTAGLLIKKPIDALSMDEINSLIGINYHGAVNVSVAAKPFLSKTSGMLINFTSSSYTRGRPYYALYSSTKAAIVNFTQALADEWSTENININCINPERTATPMRTANFGIEPEESLLSAKDVAIATLRVLGTNKSGLIVDIRKDGR